ncbi:MAG: exodeoxyribonuclease VII large subunit [Bryobacterales bacterium]
MSQLGFTFERAPERRIFSVGELTAVVRGLLEDVFGACWVSGEISNCRRAPSGHYYFTLKDADAQLKCVCFRQNALYLKVKPQDGLEIVARGRLSVYEARSEYQLYVEAIEPRGTARSNSPSSSSEEARRRGIVRRGPQTPPAALPAPRRHRHLPSERRHRGHGAHPRAPLPGLTSRLYPRKCRGEAAVWRDRARAALFGDVVIAGRGGGSLEDLLGLQRRSRRPGDSPNAPCGRLRRRPPDGFHHRRLRRRPARTHAFGGRQVVAPSLQDLQAGVRNLDERLTKPSIPPRTLGPPPGRERRPTPGCHLVRRRIQRLWHGR